MSDFQFLNEHVNLKTEINDELRIVYNNAVNAEKYYAVDSKKMYILCKRSHNGDM